MPHDLLHETGLHLIWFDSMGAKSSCIAVEINNQYILIDPGAAAMQPSYPLPSEEKRLLRKKAVDRIREYSISSEIIIITHYHYDHHILPDDRDLSGENIYGGKTIYIKNPNEYINNSQWSRARLFLEKLLSLYGYKLDDFLEKPMKRKYRDPLYDLRYIHNRDYGDYSRRRKELLRKGREWFFKLTDLWKNNPWIKDNIVLSNNTRILWGEGRRFKKRGVEVNIWKPFFHGIEYDRTGWVTPVSIETRGYRVIYSSDLMGPIIEDYAYIIADYSPDIIILDGPPTYLFPYMFNRINLNRAIDNLKTIIDSRPILIIYDHHLLRDINWRKYLKNVFEYAAKNKVKLLTASEVYGEKPLIDKIAGS